MVERKKYGLKKARKRPQFSERSYGYRSFTALLNEASSYGLIQIHRDQRSGTFVVDGFCE